MQITEAGIPLHPAKGSVTAQQHISLSLTMTGRRESSQKLMKSKLTATEPLLRFDGMNYATAIFASPKTLVEGVLKVRANVVVLLALSLLLLVVVVLSRIETA